MIREVVKENDTPYIKHVEYVEDNKVIGILDYSLIYERIEIDNIKVNEDYRNQNIGSKLMSYLVSVAIENRVVNITLEVRKSNEVAIHLYKKFGFHEVAIRKYYYGDEDAILMEKQVM